MTLSLLYQREVTFIKFNSLYNQMYIQDVKKRYKDEWVLILVQKVDNLNQPVEGQLLAHSKNRDEIYEKMKGIQGHTYTLYTGDIPKGYAVTFNVTL